MANFTIGRKDGRSNARVIIELVKQTDVPGTLFTYESFIDALNVGAAKTYTLQDARCIVRQAIPRLLKEFQRTLTNVRGVGYRIPFAKEHGIIARDHGEKGNRQMSCALRVLENVRWDEMDENTRNAHQGNLMLTSAVYAQVRALRTRQSAVEHALETLKSRVDSMTQNS